MTKSHVKLEIPKHPRRNIQCIGRYWWYNEDTSGDNYIRKWNNYGIDAPCAEHGGKRRDHGAGKGRDRGVGKRGGLASRVVHCIRATESSTRSSGGWREAGTRALGGNGMERRHQWETFPSVSHDASVTKVIHSVYGTAEGNGKWRISNGNGRQEPHVVAPSRQGGDGATDCRREWNEVGSGGIRERKRRTGFCWAAIGRGRWTAVGSRGKRRRERRSVAACRVCCRCKKRRRPISVVLLEGLLGCDMAQRALGSGGKLGPDAAGTPEWPAGQPKGVNGAGAKEWREEDGKITDANKRRFGVQKNAGNIGRQQAALLRCLHSHAPVAGSSERAGACM
ncbi:hypothetical protein B0H19DRAFT_1081644 [Mycena capillaripes]|nr:hypothetical protein B0H19DRAFT_1081644 [Mycena capillaripes]